MDIKRKKLKIGFFAGLILLLIIPFVVEGAIPDFLTQTITGISAYKGPIIGAYILSFFILVAGTAGVYIATSLLQWVINITPEALTVLSGDAAQIIQVGWNFTVGIANMLLILAFIFVALCTILGIEKYHLQKLFPKLIIVALLMNFTLLFVGAGIDISNFLFNSVASQFSDDGGNVLFAAIEPLFNLTHKLIDGTIGYVLTYGVLSLIPIKGVVAAVANLLAFPFLFPYIIQYFFIGGILLIMSGLFFLFFLILLMRIFVIQILTILAPLAFLCLIFDDTKSLWKLWLNHLVQWLFVGVAFIFFMYLGLALAPLTITTAEPVIRESPYWLRWFTAELVPYIVLSAYFMVIFFVIRKFIPALATAAISSVQNIATQISPYGKAFVKGSGKWSDQAKTESGSIQRAGSWAENLGADTEGGLRGSLARAATKPFRSFGSWATRSPIERERSSIEEAQRKLDNTSPQRKASSFTDSPLLTDKLAAILAAANQDQGEEFARILGRQLHDMFNNLHRKSTTLGNNRDLERSLPVHYLVNEIRQNRTPPQEHNFIHDRLGNGEHMERAAGHLIPGLDSTNATIQAQSQRIVNAILRMADTSHLKALMRGSDRDQFNRLRTEINNQGGLATINPQADLEFQRNPGGPLAGL